MFYSIFFSVCIYTSGSSLLDTVFLFLSMFLISCKHKWFWTLDVGRTASYENHSCPSVCLSVRLSLSFLKIGSLVFSDIVHNDSWSWYLARFLKKKKRQSEFGPSRPKSGPKWGFLPFYWVWIICDHYNHMMYTMIACDNLTFSWSKTHAKNLGGPKFGPNRPISCQN